MLNIDAIHMREINMPLAHPFETSFGLTTARRILLIELESEGLTAWGECVAGEHPYFSDETIDTAWLMIENELGPSLLEANVERGGSCPDIFRQVRGHRMAKAALENAVWDLEAQVIAAEVGAVGGRLHRIEVVGEQALPPRAESQPGHPAPGEELVEGERRPTHRYPSLSRFARFVAGAVARRLTRPRVGAWRVAPLGSVCDRRSGEETPDGS